MILGYNRNSYIDKLFGYNLILNRTHDGNSIMGIAQQVSEKARSLKRNQEYAELEDFLTNLYYGVSDSAMNNDGIEEIQNEFSKVYQEKLNAIFQRVGEENVNTSSNQTKKEKAPVTKIRFTRALEYQKILQHWLKKKNINIREIYNMKENLEKTYDETTEKVIQLWQKIEKYHDRPVKNIKDKSILQLIAELENEGIYLSKLPSLAAIGDLGEQSLAVADQVLLGYIDQNSSKLVKEGFKNTNPKDLGGSQYIKGVELYENGQIYLPGDEEKKHQNYYYFGSGETQVKVFIGAINNYKQKMDVEFILPSFNEQEKLRVSMKSWDNMTSRDLGSTTLLNAMLRTVGIDHMYAFGLQLRRGEDTNWNVSGLLQWAKTIALLDIVAGMGQLAAKNTEGYADTLIIQDRQNQRFYIYSIGDIIDLAFKNDSNSLFKLSGYDEGMVSKMTFSTLKRIGNYDWRGIIAGSLQTQKISVDTKA